MVLLRVLIYMLFAWVGGVWIAWGITGYVSEVICADGTWRWVWLIAAFVLAGVLAGLLTRDVRSGRLRLH